MNVFLAELGLGRDAQFFKKIHFTHPNKTKLDDFLASSTHIRLLFPPFSFILVKFRQYNGCRASFQEAED
jgi:hypothetical protein